MNRRVTNSEISPVDRCRSAANAARFAFAGPRGGAVCDAHAAAQSVALEDIQNVTISNNTMAGKGTKAFALARDSTGTVVRGNKIGDGYGREVGFEDETARKGYRARRPDDSTDDTIAAMMRSEEAAIGWLGRLTSDMAWTSPFPP
jgi:hypothetical protein